MKVNAFTDGVGCSSKLNRHSEMLQHLGVNSRLCARSLIERKELWDLLKMKNLDWTQAGDAR